MQRECEFSADVPVDVFVAVSSSWESLRWVPSRGPGIVRGMRIWAVGVVLLLAACGGGDGGDDKESLHVEITLHDAKVGGLSDTCFGQGGYDDIKAGIGVTVRDGESNIVGSGRLDNIPGEHPTRGECILSGDVEVGDADFYAVEVGHRGEQTYSREELDGRGWMVLLELGDS